MEIARIGSSWVNSLLCVPIPPYSAAAVAQSAHRGVRGSIVAAQTAKLILAFELQYSTSLLLINERWKYDQVAHEPEWGTAR